MCFSAAATLHYIFPPTHNLYNIITNNHYKKGRGATYCKRKSPPTKINLGGRIRNWKITKIQGVLQYDCKKKKGGKTRNENLTENKSFNKVRADGWFNFFLE